MHKHFRVSYLSLEFYYINTYISAQQLFHLERFIHQFRIYIGRECDKHSCAILFRKLNECVSHTVFDDANAVMRSSLRLYNARLHHEPLHIGAISLLLCTHTHTQCCNIDQKFASGRRMKLNVLHIVAEYVCTTKHLRDI